MWAVGTYSFTIHTHTHTHTRTDARSQRWSGHYIERSEKSRAGLRPHPGLRARTRTSTCGRGVPADGSHGPAHPAREDTPLPPGSGLILRRMAGLRGGTRSISWHSYTVIAIRGIHTPVLLWTGSVQCKS